MSASTVKSRSPLANRAAALMAGSRVGTLVVQGILARDVPLVQGAVLVITRGSTRVLQAAATDLAHGAQQVASASQQVASASQQLSQGATEQAASLEETSASMEEMSSEFMR